MPCSAYEGTRQCLKLQTRPEGDSSGLKKLSCDTVLASALILLIPHYAVTSHATVEALNVCHERNAKELAYPNTVFHPER